MLDLTIALGLCLSAGGGWSTGQPPPGAAPGDEAVSIRLESAIELFSQLNEEQAGKLFREVLALNPTSAQAAQAHLYLGLIALNAGNNPDLVRRELKAAVTANPAIELPTRLTSPKAQLSLMQARADLAKELQSVLAPPQAKPAPPEATAVVAPEPPRWHVASWALIGVGVAAAATAVIGAVQVANFNSMAARANANPGTFTQIQLASARSNAQFWADAWIPFAIGSAACGGAAVLVW